MSLNKVDEKLADYSADHFLNGALVTNADNIIVYANTYFQKEKELAFYQKLEKIF